MTTTDDKELALLLWRATITINGKQIRVDETLKDLDETENPKRGNETMKQFTHATLFILCFMGAASIFGLLAWQFFIAL